MGNDDHAVEQVRTAEQRRARFRRLVGPGFDEPLSADDLSIIEEHAAGGRGQRAATAAYQRLLGLGLIAPALYEEARPLGRPRAPRGPVDR